MATAWYINNLSGSEIPDDDYVIPEPTTLVLFGLGALGLVWIRRRKQT